MTIRTVQQGSHTHAQGYHEGGNVVLAGTVAHTGKLVPVVRREATEESEMTPVIERGVHDV